MQKCLLLLTRFPTAGKVKSRLAADIGTERAAAIQKGMLLDILNRFLRIQGMHLKILYPKNEQAQPFRNLCRRYGFPQTRLRFLRGVGNMSDDIVHGFRTTLVQYDKVALIASDLPHYTENQLTELWDALDEFDAAYHPSDDDGCCPLGFRKFGDMWTNNDSRAPGYIRRWQKKATAQGLSYTALSPVFDVDYLRDVMRIESEYANQCPFTMKAWLNP